MPLGRQIVEQLFPGIHTEMMSWGAPLVDMANDVAWLTPQGWGVNFRSNLEVLSFTRPLLDLHVRQKLAANQRILIMQDSQVSGLTNDDKDRVTGVLVSVRSQESGEVDLRLPADLVVDATGRASRAPQWLKELGYPAPEEITVNAHLGYASRFYEIPEGFSATWKCVFVQAAPPERKRGGILFTVEGNRWLVTMIGGGGDYPPKDDEAFLDFARSLPEQRIYHAIRNANPLSSIKVHRGTENRLRQFDKLKRRPRNFIALGDAVCAFNPVYGQGMTIAAMGAMTLDESLRETGSNNEEFATRFQKQLAKVNAAPWMLATSEDFRYRETEGGTASRMTRFMHLYMDRVLKLSTFDQTVRHVLLQAFGMLVPPTALFHPTILFRVICHSLSTPFQPKRKKVERVSEGTMAYEAAD
jgi:2-polyprenyl-6-methoxyphenol hydroxylase-like FAD-dependent oxidoreductase